MNRERKYRVWDIHKKVFIPTDVYGLITTDFGAFGIMIKDWEDYKEGEYFYPQSQIQSDWTGLVDKNGTDIYEGDIVKRNDGVIKYVFYNERQGGFYTQFENTAGFIDPLSYATDRECEVIGNINQHHHLLKQ